MMNIVRRLFRSGNNLDSVARLIRYGISSNQVESLRQLFLTAKDHELYLANPSYLLEKMGINKQDGFNLLMTGVTENLFRIYWIVTCSECGTEVDPIQDLVHVRSQYECIGCGAHYRPALDDEISVTLTVHEHLRLLDPEKQDQEEWRKEIDERLGKVSGLDVVNLNGFRQLVSTQQIAEGQSLGVKEVAVFFSDLKQSTAFYHRLGDAEAYYWVAEHFKIMFSAVQDRGGTAVKTMGDGVMGVFDDPIALLSSLEDIARRLKKLNLVSGLNDEDQLVLKIGAHIGGCIVVSLNGRLDYFGETVNIAARLGGVSKGSDLILSSALMDLEEVKSFIENKDQVTELDVELKGLPGAVHIYSVPWNG